MLLWGLGRGSGSQLCDEVCRAKATVLKTTWHQGDASGRADNKAELKSGSDGFSVSHITSLKGNGSDKRACLLERWDSCVNSSVET